MAPLAENLTHRVYFDYVTGYEAGVSQNHTVMFRANAELLINDAQLGLQARFAAIIQAMTNSNFRVGWGVTGVRVSEAGSLISLPVDKIPALATFIGQNNAAGWFVPNEAIQYRFEGRSPVSGRRVSLSLYGLFIDDRIDKGFRIYTSELATLGATIDALTDPEGVRPVCRDNTLPTFYRYLNCQYNSYWERQLRS